MTYSLERTFVGFHGHYDANGQLNRALVERFGLLEWIIKYSDGKADRDLVQRWINIELNTGMVAFMHPQQTVRFFAAKKLSTVSDLSNHAPWGAARWPSQHWTWASSPTSHSAAARTNNGLGEGRTYQNTLGLRIRASQCRTRGNQSGWAGRASPHTAGRRPEGGHQGVQVIACGPGHGGQGVGQRIGEGVAAALLVHATAVAQPAGGGKGQPLHRQARPAARPALTAPSVG